MVRAALLAALCCLALFAAADTQARPRGSPYDYNQPKGGCGKFGWSLTRELAWFAKSDNPTVSTPATQDKLPDGALVLELEADGEANLVMPPERRSRSGNGYGGAVSFAAVPRAGLYQITLSEDALLDVIQNGKYLRKAASHMRRDCPAIRRSVRVTLTAEPLVLQFGGVEMPTVTIAVAPVE